MDNNVVILVEGGKLEKVEEGMKGINGDGKCFQNECKFYEMLIISLEDTRLKKETIPQSL